MAQLGNAFMNDLLSTVLLNHAQHEAVIRGSFEGCWISVSTLQLLSRAFMSREMDLIRSRSCSRTAVGERAGNFRLGSLVR